MRSPHPLEDDAFLRAEAHELAALAEDCCAGCDRGGEHRRCGSVLHTLSVELSVLAGLGDDRRMDWLAAEATRLLSSQGKHDAVSAFRATLARLKPSAVLPRAS